MNNTLVYNTKGILPTKFNENADDMLSRIVNITIGIADLVAVVGAVIGLVQVLVSCPAGEAVVTVDKTSSPKVLKSRKWLGDQSIDACELTVDVVSLVNIDAPVEKFIDEFIV